MINVIKPGFYTTVQDQGRFGYREYGVPIAGSMDAIAAGLANRIVGNSPDAALLEIALGNVELCFEKQTLISITGANFSPTINAEVVNLNRVLQVQAGDLLRFRFPKQGALTYLAVAGGIQTPKVLGSRSFYPELTTDAQLKAGMKLPIVALSALKLKLGAIPDMEFDPIQHKELAVYPGPEFDVLSSEEQEMLMARPFTLSSSCNRMGFRFEEQIAYAQPQSILTAGVLPGTVQLTPSGVLIVLMADCQVTGGYPRVLQLSRTALSCLAQKKPGDVVEFQLKKLV